MTRRATAGVLGFVALTALLLGPLPAAQTPDELVGLWGCDTTFGPAVRGELTVTRRPSAWAARIAGREAAVRTAEDSLYVTLSDGQGEFRGRLEDSGRIISGFWIQPAGVVGGAPYASPVTLSRSARDAWHGAIVPLDERYQLYLMVRREADGSLTAAFRNPEANNRGGAPRLRVTLDGDSLRLRDVNRPENQLMADYAPTSRRIALPWPALGVTLILIPRAPERASGFYPRLRSDRTYVYRRPPKLTDAWPTTRAASVGLDEQALTSLMRRIAAADPMVDTSPRIHSLLVARHGKLVLEEYFHGFTRDRTHDLRSASKTFASVLVGAAIDHGALAGVDTPVYAVFGGVGGFAHPDPRKERITVAHLLTHSSGLACDDGDDNSPGEENRMQSQQAQPDWYRYTLDLPIVHAPGEVYAYCSAGINLVGGVLERVTGVWLPQVFERDVAQPLQFGRYYMNLMPTGDGYAGGGLILTPWDLLKLGAAYLDGGTWHGRRLVSREWVERSTAHQITTGGASDGYAWHCNSLAAGGRAYREYEANGNGGQFLIVLPELDLAIAFTAGNYGQYLIWRKLRDDLVPRFVIAAIRAP